MISGEDLPCLAEYMKSNAGSKKSYYGLNISSNIDLEPIDQLDGFLVAKYIQNLFGAQEKFYAYIAGVYNALNARSYKEALKTAEKRKMVEQQKNILLRRIMSKIDVSGDVLTTYDMWEDENYWMIVDELFRDGVYDSMPDEQKMVETIRLTEFPLEILGRMRNVVKNIPLSIRSGSLYIPLEVAEAMWLRDMYDVEWKIGPPSEEIYDKFISSRGIGIIRLKQPQAIENDCVKAVMPYIGKSTQPYRILFSDTEDTVFKKRFPENPSLQEALNLASIYEEVSGLETSNDTERIRTLINLGKGSNLL